MSKSDSEKLEPTMLEKRLRYMARQYSSSLRGGGCTLEDHYLWQAAEYIKEHEPASSPPLSREKVLAEVAKERQHQDIKWGGSEHDDQHESKDFAGFISDRADRIFGDDVDPRSRFIQMAALAVAAIEMIDREALLSPTALEEKCEHGKGLSDYCQPCGRVNGGE